eukprot:TRINITY_DN29247_c0_g1_i2.p1 TRINITY_DN29247_c0_g1~~TRINITY_DN29247_c0_g1_i2.p1  ORF type:complete len:340 (-),score=117.14 TRINITY_DN29247_c0_g1_i2:168-1187(-)
MARPSDAAGSATTRIISAADEELIYAARQRDILGCKRAIKKGADVNVEDEGDCPLHWAAFWGDRAVTQVLLAAGADRSIPNKYGRIAAVDAQRMGHTDVVRILFEWGPEAVEETRVAGAEIAALENAHDTAGLAAYIDDHRRNFILRFQCDEAEMVLSKMVKEENVAKQELANAVHAKDIDQIEIAHDRAVIYLSLRDKAAAADVLRNELLHLERDMIDSLHKLIEQARARGPTKLQAGIEAARRKGRRLAGEVEAAQQRLVDLDQEWDGMCLSMKEALSVAKQAVEDKEDAEEKMAEVDELLAEMKCIKPVAQTVEAVSQALEELKIEAANPKGGKKK